MQINELLHQAKDKVVQLREIIISPVQLQQHGRLILLQDSSQPKKIWQRIKRTTALALMLVGAITVFGGFVGMYVSPGVQRRASEIQRLQKEYKAKKISWEKFAQGYDEVTRK